MAEDVFFEYPGENRFHEGIILNEFKGEFSFVAGKIWNDKAEMKWIYPQDKDRKPLDKTLPWKIKLGDGKDNAIEMLRLFIKALQGTEEMIEETIEAEEDEIPF